MTLYFFSVPVRDPGAAQDEFNQFCAAQRVVAIERQFVSAGLDSHWALCVQVASGPGPLPASLKRPSSAGPAEPRIDYKTLLSDSEFKRFAALRALRKTLAERDGVPLYGVFTNEQLAAMARLPAATLADLQGIEGVGPVRVQRYEGPARGARPRARHGRHLVRVQQRGPGTRRRRSRRALRPRCAARRTGPHPLLARVALPVGAVSAAPFLCDAHG
jgi:hypothetical protein